MSRESFLMYLSFREPLKLLNDVEFRQIVDAMFDYQATGTCPDFNDRTLQAIWMQFQGQFDRDSLRYEVRCEQNRENGRKGGAPAGNQNARKTTETSKRLKNNRNNRKQPKQPDTDTESESESESENNTRENPESDFTLSAPAVADDVFSFTEFWKTYGLKIDRTKCEAKYRRLTRAEREAIKAALPRYVAATPEGAIPRRKNPLTWLNGRCWLDEEVPVPHTEQPQQSRAEREMAELEAFARSQRP